jgi:hypothetical protein
MVSLHEVPCTFVIISHLILIKVRMCQTEFVEKNKTQILCSITIFFRKSCLYERTWKNTVAPDCPQLAILCRRLGCWISKVQTFVLRVYNKNCFSNINMIARTRLNVTLKTYFARLVQSYIQF